MIQRLTIIATIVIVTFSCSPSKRAARSVTSNTSVKVALDLANVVDDKVRVTVTPPAITAPAIEYHFAKTIPGTYAVESYGKYIDGLKAIDKSGKPLTVTKLDDNTWQISQADQLASLSYLVNDTYDNEGADVFEEGSTTIFSPAGTNILAGKNFVLNMCGFAGYFSGLERTPYEITISHPAGLRGVSSLNDMDPGNTTDLFKTSGYAEMVDCPIMYAPPDIATFNIDGMEVILSVYSSSNKAVTSKAFAPNLERMIRAQKNFLGDINNTKKYAVLVYASSMATDDAQGIGALEHNFSTMGVFRSNMTSKDLIHVISHEFFHTLTPLNIHSKEIHYFNFADPKMSQHLWMYEGFTEYFAQFFQANQGLVSEDRFLAEMASKVITSRQNYNDNQSFTEMSRNVLDDKMKTQYPNVYMKGALMAMCLDIIIRDHSSGKRGLKSVMGELSRIYGPDRPFDDDDLIPQFVKLTYPEVGEFINNYIVKGGPIDYDSYLSRVGITPVKVPVPEPIVFAAHGKPYVGVDTVQKKAFAVVPDKNNNFMNELGLQSNDILLEMNGQVVDGSNPMSIMILGYDLEEGEPVTMKIERKGKVMQLKGKVALNYNEGDGYKFTDQSKKALHDAWLKD